METVGLVDLVSATKLVGVSQAILRRWWEDGAIEEPKVFNRKRYFTQDQLKDIQAFKAGLESGEKVPTLPDKPLDIAATAEFFGVPKIALLDLSISREIPIQRNGFFPLTSFPKIKAALDARADKWVQALANQPDDRRKAAQALMKKGWSPLAAEPDVQMVSKRELIVPEYHRAHSAVTINRLAQTLDWSLFGALVVNARADGKLYVMQGVLRLEAALKRGDIDEVPVVIVEGLTLSQEINRSVLAQTSQKRLRATDRVLELAEAGDEIATTLVKMVESIGRSLRGRGAPHASFEAVRMLEQMLTQYPDQTAAVWGAVGDLCDGRKITARVLKALVLTEVALQDGKTFAEPALKFELLSVGYEKVMEAIEGLIKVYGPSDKVLVEGVAAALNRGGRTVIKVSV